MKNLPSRSKTSLFLMEMIISLLILSLTACICIQIFASAKNYREQAREYNHIQELTITAGEFLEGSSGESSEYLALFPDGEEKNGHLYYYFDRTWNRVSPEYSHYYMELYFYRKERQKCAAISFYEKEELLFSQEISFPLFSAGKEAPAL